jgi:hypothetical protein
MPRPAARAVAALGGLLALTGAGPARAADPASQPTSAGPSDVGDRTAEITGPVRKIDPSTHTLFLRNSMKTLRYSDDTKVTKGGQETSILQLNEGDQVRAMYSGAGDDVKVTRLEVLP